MASPFRDLLKKRSPRAAKGLADGRLVFECALALRLIAAFAVFWLTQRKGLLCVFSDTTIYWALASSIRLGEPFEILQWGIPHQALRTPGYPLFLAACQAIFGDSLLAPRLVQAILGALGALIVFRLARGLAKTGAGALTVAWLAAWLAALDPYSAGLSALLLSEGVFMPLMLVSLWGWAKLWEAPGDPQGERLSVRASAAWAIGVGLATGSAIMVRPSWLLFPPFAIAVWLIATPSGRRQRAWGSAGLVVLTAVLVMAPWWSRNHGLFGRVVPTALWMGASLYDGINPQADGGSEMSFLDDPAFWPLDEIEQDRALQRGAIDFLRESPGEVLRLTAVKAWRFWSPWPNAQEMRFPVIGWLVAAWTAPLLVLTAVGAWGRRGDWRGLVLSAGPLLYFFALHLIFVSSVRYRIPGMVPALILAAEGVSQMMKSKAAIRIIRRPEGPPSNAPTA